MQYPMRHTDGLVQERRNSSALGMEFRLSCTNPSIYRPGTFMYALSYLSTFYEIRHQPAYINAVQAAQGSDFK